VCSIRASPVAEDSGEAEQGAHEPDPTTSEPDQRQVGLGDSHGRLITNVAKCRP
jgi:hypothetical protein